MGQSQVSSQEARPTAPSQPNQSARPVVTTATPLPASVQRSAAPHALSAISEADAREDAERRRQLMTLGLEVALAVMLTVAARVWGWVREERARARVNRELRRRAPAT